MREPIVDVVARLMARSQDRRRLLSILAGAIAVRSLWPHTARADSREQCQDKRERCKDRVRTVCPEHFRTFTSPYGGKYLAEYVSMCQNNAISQCCENLYDWKPREGDDGECASERDFDPCVDRVIRGLEAGYRYGLSRGPGGYSSSKKGRDRLP